jgi:hypothetical protein
MRLLVGNRAMIRGPRLSGWRFVYLVYFVVYLSEYLPLDSAPHV